MRIVHDTTMVTAETATAILANLTTVLVAVAAGGRWVWKNLQDRLEAVEGQVGNLESPPLSWSRPRPTAIRRSWRR